MKRFLVVLMLSFAGSLAFASQNPLSLPTAGTLSGLNAVQDINNAADSLNTCNSGPSAPANQLSGAPSPSNCWDDTSVSGWIAHKIYDGTSWIAARWIDTTNHLYVGKVGGGAPANVASATTTDLCSVNPAYLNITGTTPIASFGTNCQTGQWKRIQFSGVLTLTYNVTSLILPGGVSVTTTAGDTADAVYLGSGNWIVTAYHSASALPLGPIASHTILANTAGAPAPAAPDTLTSIIDAMIGNTQGDILYRGASGWSALAPGIANQLLQTGGSGANPSWVTVAAPVLLNSLTASNSASLTDTTSITATYNAYELVFEGLVCATASQSLELLSHSNSAFQNAGYVSAIAGSVTSAPTTYIPLTVAETQIDGGFSGQARIYNPSQALSPKQWIGNGGYVASGPAARAVIFQGVWAGGNSAVDGFEVICASGNITSGSIRVYGLP